MNCFYENFLRLCNKIGKSPSAVALEIGLAKTTVTRWKKGGGITDKVASTLADYFCISVDELLHGSPDTSGTPGFESRDTFARNLRNYIEQSQMTQKELAETIGVSTSTLNDWVKGEKYPRIDKIDLLANCFGVSKADLIEDKPPVNAGTDSNLTQKSEKALLDVIIRFHTDPDFLHTVERLNSLTSDQFESIKQMLKAFSK